MRDEKKTKAQLLEDLTRLRQRLMAMERREAERPACREHPYAATARVDPKLAGPVADEGDRCTDIGRNLGRLHPIRRAVIAWSSRKR